MAFRDFTSPPGPAGTGGPRVGRRSVCRHPPSHSPRGVRGTAPRRDRPGTGHQHGAGSPGNAHLDLRAHANPCAIPSLGVSLGRSSLPRGSSTPLSLSQREALAGGAWQEKCSHELHQRCHPSKRALLISRSPGRRLAPPAGSCSSGSCCAWFTTCGTTPFGTTRRVCSLTSSTRAISASWDRSTMR